MFIHVFFFIFHIVALFALGWGLLITIPLHVIVAMMGKNTAKMEQQTKLLKEQNEMLKRQNDNRF